MTEKQPEPVAAADDAFAKTEVGSAALAPEESALAADPAEPDRRIKVERIRADAADAIRPGPAAT